jgi:tricorn protease-like protein
MVTRRRFSPDGKWIAYSKAVSLQIDDLYLIAAAGGSAARHQDPGIRKVLPGAKMGNAWWRSHRA